MIIIIHLSLLTHSLITSDDLSINQMDDGKWTKVMSRQGKSRRKQNVVVGTGQVDEELQTIERQIYIQAWSFRPDTTTEMVLKYLNKIQQSDLYYVEKRELKTDRHASFIIGLRESLYKKFESPTVWPPHVKFTEWFLRRPRMERGTSNNKRTNESTN